jgi:hypothetical protein
MSLSGLRFGDPSLPATTAAMDPGAMPGRQPGGRPLGYATGAPPRTQLTQVNVTPNVNALGVVQQPTLIVPGTTQNRFVTLTAPLLAFAILVSSEASFNPFSSYTLPPGLPCEISLPGNEALYAVTTSPVFVPLQIQIAPAIASDTERRLGPG